MQGGVGHVMPYDQQVMLSRLQGNMPPEQILESMYGGGINPAALLQARHGMYAQQVPECPLSTMHASTVSQMALPYLCQDVLLDCALTH